MGHMMTLEQATTIYLGIHNLPTGDLRADLITSGTIAHKWRTVGPEATATIVHALHRHYEMSHRQIERATGIPRTNVARLITELESGKWETTVPEGGEPV